MWDATTPQWVLGGAGLPGGWRAGACLRSALVLLCLGGCASVQEPLRGNLSAASAEVASCARWFRALDRRIDSAGVRDGGEFRVPGFPYLRTDRFSASLRDIATEHPAFEAWVGRMRAMDRAAREAELRNLPERALMELGETWAAATARTEACASTLMTHDRALPEIAHRVAQRARVPDDYKTWQRVLGLYGITRLPFFVGVEGWQKEAVEVFRRSASADSAFARSNDYRPAASDPRDDSEAILARSPPDALGIPQFSPPDLERLFEQHAPVIEVEAGGAFDEIGALAWHDGPAPAVDAGRPTVYRKLAYTRHGPDTLVQLVYVAWFSERPRRNFFDMLAGRLDGVVWRVTLDREGAPLMYDTIHPCGCFHMFFPVEGVRPVAAPSSLIEWAFVPAPAPPLAAGQRIRLRLQSRTHYLVGVAADHGEGGHAYRFDDYDRLRALPAAGGSRSVFRPDGLIAGTQRGERTFFWPMGVPSAGAMRQWGRQATAFLGRRHFDDANLIESRFVLPAR